MAKTAAGVLCSKLVSAYIRFFRLLHFLYILATDKLDIISSLHKRRPTPKNCCENSSNPNNRQKSYVHGQGIAKNETVFL